MPKKTFCIYKKTHYCRVHLSLYQVRFPWHRWGVMPLGWAFLICPVYQSTMWCSCWSLSLALWTITFIPLQPGLSLVPSDEKSLIQPELMYSDPSVSPHPRHAAAIIHVPGVYNSGSSLERRMERKRATVLLHHWGHGIKKEDNVKCKRQENRQQKIQIPSSGEATPWKALCSLTQHTFAAAL